MSSLYTYKGFSTINKNKIPFSMVDKELVKRDILNHFMTRKGERVMLPEFGSIIHDKLMDPLDNITKEEIKEDISNIINSDPRVKLRNFDLVDSEHSLKIRLFISYVELDQIVDEMYVDFVKQ